MEAYKLSSRRAGGFDWPEMEGLFEKLAEETAELREELKASPFAGSWDWDRGVGKAAVCCGGARATGR